MFKAEEERLRLSSSLDLEMAKATMPVFREVIELIYKIRNSARDVINDRTPIGPHRDLFSECCALLTQRLYMYRLFLDRPTFEQLHSFKRQSQDFMVLLDIADRQSTLAAHRMAFSNETLERLETLYMAMNQTHEEITAAMQAKFRIGG